MKSIKLNPEDSLRPEYKRSDFGELVQGKYATTDIDYRQLTHILLSCLVEDEGLKFMHHSRGNNLADQKPGDWTYELDNANQITLRYWLSESGSIQETISNPPNVMTAQEREELQYALVRGVMALKTKVLELKGNNSCGASHSQDEV